MQFLKPHAGWRFIALRAGGSPIAAVAYYDAWFQLAGLVRGG
jgi:hypothetical protein